jgi:hypothetical protein
MNIERLIWLRHVPMYGLTLGALAAGCSASAPSSPATTEPAASTTSTTDSVATPGATWDRTEWHRTMSRTPLPKEGCFQVTHPSSTWTEVPCTTAPDKPYIPASGRGRGVAQTVGNGIDISSEVTGNISWAEGSFPSVVGVTSENDDGVANDYSLQLNSNMFANASLCQGQPAGCLGWEQFLYVPGNIFIQYWLINYTGTCPAGWNAFEGDCYKNSTSVAAPSAPITDLANLALIGNAGALDTVSMTFGNDTLYAVSQASVLGLNKGWTTAEFNVVGDGGGSEATFNSGATIVVQTLTDSASGSTSAPTCDSEGFTGETNNLNLVAASCCAVSGSSPEIQFTQSNVAGAKGQACPPGVEWAPVAFQASTNALWIDQNGAGTNTSLGMKAGTVPSLAMLQSGGLEVAFQANTGDLWIEQNGAGHDQKLGMAPGTSPSMTILQDGTIAVAFQANTGDLWIDQNGKGSDQKLAMAPGTSPSIALLQNGSIAVAFQATSGDLWIEQNGKGTDQKLGMAPGTSPSIAVLPDGTIAVAFQANSGNLWVEQNGKGTDQKLGMAPGTSPSIAVLLSGSTAVAFQANTGDLWVDEDGVGHDQKLGMAAAASPVIAPIENSGYQVAFEANSGELWLDVNDVGHDQKFVMNTP